MAAGAGGAGSVGISLGPARSMAVLRQHGAFHPVGSVAGGRGDFESLISAAVDCAGSDLEAVTVDLSAVLLDAIRRADGDLPRIAVLRIVPRAATDPALARSPADLVERLITLRATVRGGHDLLGSELCPLDRVGLAEVCGRLGTSEVRHVAIVGAGSQACPDHERAAAEAVQASLPGAGISVASDFGGHGLVAREATVALDCALRPLTDRLVARGERALARHAPGVPLRVTRGDGGHGTAARIRALPVVALGATDALQVAGAAVVAGEPDCRVLLPRGDALLAGDVRHGLVAVRSGEPSNLGVELVLPTAVLTPELGSSRVDELRRITDVPVVLADRNPDELACIGAAVSRPTSWLDEFAFIESAAQLERIRREAQDRANAIVMANGAAPGSTFVAEVSAVAVPYSPPGTVRIRVRVAGAPDTDPRRLSVSDRMAP